MLGNVAVTAFQIQMFQRTLTLIISVLSALKSVFPYIKIYFVLQPSPSSSSLSSIRSNSSQIINSAPSSARG